jgi:hypothetical protein
VARRQVGVQHEVGHPIEPRNFNRSWDARCRKTGVRKITVHDGRRTCATLLVDLDVHPREVMRILRHVQIAVTMEIYAQASSKATVLRLSDWKTASMGDLLLYFVAVLLKICNSKIVDQGSDLGGQYWDRTSDLFGVNADRSTSGL